MARSNVCKWLLLILTACVVSSGLPAMGQSTFGSIVGTVKDQSGSVVPGATVTLVNVGSSSKHTTTSSASGNYEFPNLDAGIYQVSIQASGFKDADLRPPGVAGARYAAHRCQPGHWRGVTNGRGASCGRRDHDRYVQPGYDQDDPRTGGSAGGRLLAIEWIDQSHC